MKGLIVIGQTGQVARELALLAPGARFLPRAACDLSDPDGAARALRDAIPGASAVINAAAWTAVDKAEAEEAAATIVNATAPGLLAQVAADHGVPFLHVSTDYVFDGGGDRPFAPDDPTGPLNAYGRSKLAGEQAVRAAGGAHLILRTSWVFSAHGTDFLKTMLRLSETRDALSVVDDQHGGPTPAPAIAAALLSMAGQMADGAPGGTHHLSGAPDTTWADFARTIFAAAGRAVTVTGIPSAQYPTPARRPLNSRLDCSGLSLFGLTQPDWRAALGPMIKALT